MKTRKTIEVAFVKERANTMLMSTKLTAEQKYGLVALLESVLHETNNYRGYQEKEKYNRYYS